MQIQHLHLLLAIAEHGSLRAAAQALRLSQPALTRSLNQLEEEIGAVLAIRTPRGICLSAEGKILATQASKALNELGRGSEELAWHAEHPRSRLAVGLSPLLDPLLAQRAMACFRQRDPDVRLRMVEAPFARSRALLRSGAIDLAIGPLPPGEYSADLVAPFLFQSANVVVASALHPLSKAQCLADLVDARWVRVGHRAGPGDPAQLDWAAIGARPPAVRIECESLATLRLLLASEDLVAIVPSGFLSCFGTLISMVEIPIVGDVPVTRIRAIRKPRFTLGGPASMLLGSFVAEAHGLAFTRSACRPSHVAPAGLQP